MNLAEAAAAFRGLAEKADSDLALEACREAATDYLTVLRAVTPKRTGALADSETVTGPTGGGTHAVAEVGPHIVYADFREYGGTITVKNARVLTDGASFFGKSVTQRGAHYMERSEGPGRAAVEDACRIAVERFFTL